MKPRKIEVTQEMLKQAFRCCAENGTKRDKTCSSCYLFRNRLVRDGHMSTGGTCFQHLTEEAIAYMRRINDFKHSQCAELLQKNPELRRRLAEINNLAVGYEEEGPFEQQEAFDRARKIVELSDMEEKS